MQLLSAGMLKSAAPMDQAIIKSAPYFNLDTLREETSEHLKSSQR